MNPYIRNIMYCVYREIQDIAIIIGTPQQNLVKLLLARFETYF